MSAASAHKAFEEKRYVDSVKLFNVFMKDYPGKTTPDHFMARSTALLRLGKKDAALRDADRATKFAHVLKDKKALAKAHMRRAVTYVSLGDNASAKACVGFAEKANPDERTIPVWKAKINLSSDSGETRSVDDIPEIDISYVWKGKEPEKAEEKENAESTNGTNVMPAPTKTETAAVPAQTASVTPAAPAETRPISPPREDLRTDFFQTTDKITISVYRKNTPKDAKIAISPVSISIACSEYSWTTNLFAAVIPEQSTFQIYGTKVDFNLAKASPAKWTSESGVAVVSDTVTTSAPASTAPASSAVAATPSVRIDHFQTPTHINAYLYVSQLANYTPKVEATASNLEISFQNKEKPEDSFVRSINLYGLIEPELLQEKVYPTKLEIQMRKKTAGTWPELEKGSKESSPDVPVITAPTTKDWSKIQLDDDSDDDINTSENPDDFFKALYADADDDTRRAMMKSFVESGGTALSTDWDKVARGEHGGAEP